jgi:anion-transporting  ArsA/GET3 family ATPase
MALRFPVTDHNDPPISLLLDPPQFLFFTGKGGVGKTSLACACALALADKGLRVLLVSTDPASNLDEMLGAALSDQARSVPGAPGLDAMNIDPDAAAEAYRLRVIEQMPAGSLDADRATVREQLSGACTTEIAAFDEFIGLLAGDAAGYDHVIFDTAPTGHTLRLLSLDRVPGRQRSRRILPGAALRPEDAGRTLPRGPALAGRSGQDRHRAGDPRGQRGAARGCAHPR